MTGTSVAQGCPLSHADCPAGEMNPTDSPIIHLIRQHMVRRNIDRKTLGYLLADGRNASKTFRRLDQLLRGERLTHGFLQRVAMALQIPVGQLAVALEAHDRRGQERYQEARRMAMEVAMERRGPHLWGILPVKYLPSLITVLGAEHYLLVRLPEQIVKLPHFEQMQEAGRSVHEHYRRQRRCRLVGYEYRRSLREVYRFDVDGQYEGRVDGNPLDSRTFVRVGGREVETPLSYL